MKLLKLLFFAAAGVLFFTLFFHTSFEFKQDLGRHLLLGKIISETRQVPSTNLFTYTNPNYPFINSHWLSEVIYYQISKLFGLSSLVNLTTVLMTLTLLLILWWSYHRSKSLAATAITLAVFSPILLERTEVRPEIFAYVMISVFIVALGKYLSGKNRFSDKIIWILPVLEIIWVNSHIYFFFGPLLVVAAAVSISIYQYIKTKKVTPLSNLWLVAIIVSLLTIINPHGIKGALYPLGVFNNYGYAIEENQNIFFLEPLIFNPNIFYFKIAFIIFAASFLFRKYHFENPLDIFELLCGLLAILPALAIRLFPLIFLIDLPVFANNLANSNPEILKKVIPNWQKYQNSGRILIITAVIFFTLIRAARLISNDYYLATESEKRFGNSVVESGKNAVDFVKNNNLSGPIFNNFDVGGYLDYRLYPKQLPFVDNRPEAYPKSFFESIYYPMQANTENFNKADDFYKFNLVIFGHTDRAENFLGDLNRNSKWQLVYLDNYLTVFVKKSTYPDIAKKFAINPATFDYQSDNYLDYVYLARASLLLGWQDRGKEFLERAYKLNNNSIAVLQALGSLYVKSPTTYSLGQSLLYRYQQKSQILF